MDKLDKLISSSVKKGYTESCIQVHNQLNVLWQSDSSFLRNTIKESGIHTNNYRAFPTCIVFSNAYALSYLKFKYVKLHWQLYFRSFASSSSEGNKILHLHKIDKDYPMQEKFIYYIVHLPILSFTGPCLRILIRILISVKDTWLLETRTDVPMFSRSITCSATVPAFHFKGTMSYNNNHDWNIDLLNDNYFPTGIRKHVAVMNILN